GLIYKNEEVSFTKNSLILDEEIFKNDALIFNNKNIKSIILRDKNNNKILKVEFKDFPYLGVWSKPNLAPFVCIEPWFGVADEENSNQNIEDKRGVQVLLKDELFSCFYSIEI
ncbi:aldose 1-epimerase family protein, partial [Aliarcobacter skirrowii]|nr:aldose 1-epimerase family protein [Aliarcobacter skirrowii]